MWANPCPPSSPQPHTLPPSSTQPTCTHPPLHFPPTPLPPTQPICTHPALYLPFWPAYLCPSSPPTTSHSPFHSALCQPSTHPSLPQPSPQIPIHLHPPPSPSFHPALPHLSTPIHCSTPFYPALHSALHPYPPKVLYLKAAQVPSGNHSTERDFQIPNFQEEAKSCRFCCCCCFLNPAGPRHCGSIEH